MGFCVGCGYFEESEGWGCICGPSTPPPRTRPEDQLISTTEAMDRYRLKRDDLPAACETRTNPHSYLRPIRLFRVRDLEAAAKQRYGSLKAMNDEMREDAEKRRVRRERKREREAAAAEGRTPAKAAKKRQPKKARGAGGASVSKPRGSQSAEQGASHC